MVIAGDIRTPILGFLDALTAEKDIRAIGLGVPGIVSGGGYLSGCDSQELYKDDIGDMLNKRYGIPVILENDLNATMLGFAACYEKQNASESADMAFLFFETGCVSASFISNGKIVRGSGNFAGELNFAPLSGYGSLADLLAEPMDDARYSVVLANIACWICAVLNPKYIALGGPSFRAACIGPIGDALYALLPDGMAAELLYSPDIWADYHSGLACLTAGRIFDEVQLIKD